MLLSKDSSFAGNVTEAWLASLYAGNVTEAWLASLYAGNGSRLGRSRRSDCPGGAGKFGFNTYNLLTFLLMSFNQVQHIHFIIDLTWSFRRFTFKHVRYSPINYIDTKAKCRLLKILTCKGTLRQVLLSVWGPVPSQVLCLGWSSKGKGPCFIPGTWWIQSQNR